MSDSPKWLSTAEAPLPLHQLLATLSNATDLGTVVNIEQQSLLRVGVLTGQDDKLKQVLGEPLPPAAQPWKDYRGLARLVVMSPRGSAMKGEAMVLSIIALDKQPAKSVSVRLRRPGQAKCHSERSEESLPKFGEILRFAQDDSSARMTGGLSDESWQQFGCEARLTVIRPLDGHLRGGSRDAGRRAGRPRSDQAAIRRPRRINDGASAGGASMGSVPVDPGKHGLPTG